VVRTLGRLIKQNLRRNAKHNLLSAIGIVVGIAAFTFFLALDAGVRRVVLGEIFPVDRIEVIPPKSTLFGTARVLDDDVVQRLRNPPPDIGAEPEAVYARMKLAFPARGWGGKSLLGRERDFYFELSGFVDGVDSDIMEGEVQAPFAFEDWLGTHTPQRCGEGNSCPEGYYCAWDVYECHKPVPVVISRYMVELYNGSIAPTHPGLPKIPDFVTSVFRGKTLTVELGRSYLGSTARQGGKFIQRKLQLVGLSDKAISLGITVPIEYIERWNARYAGEDASSSYSSVVVVVKSKSDITPLAAYVKSMGFDLAESEGEKVGLFITLATVLFTLISVMIILIAAINIAHTFMMLISERRWEIGVLRAIGATRSHIRTVFLGEAAVVGLVSGVLGVGLAYLAAWACDWYSANRIPDFPFKPETYFVFSPGLVTLSVGFAVLFCLLGAFLPARRGARMEPASALAMR
jgi:ABC-type antimicrobial peptide transport system permease subunit